jgi:hypothetical protein
MGSTPNACIACTNTQISWQSNLQRASLIWPVLLLLSTWFPEAGASQVAAN